MNLLTKFAEDDLNDKWIISTYCQESQFKSRWDDYNIFQRPENVRIRQFIIIPTSRFNFLTKFCISNRHGNQLQQAGMELDFFIYLFYLGVGVGSAYWMYYTIFHTNIPKEYIVTLYIFVNLLNGKCKWMNMNTSNMKRRQILN